MELISQVTPTPLLLNGSSSSKGVVDDLENGWSELLLLRVCLVDEEVVRR